MRLLTVHSNTDLYGASRSLLRLTGRLVRDGHVVTALLPGPGPLVDALKGVGASVFLDAHMAIITRNDLRSPLGALRLAFSIPLSVARTLRIIRAFRPDVIHTNTAVILSSALAARLARLPHLWHVRESFAEFPALWKVHQYYIRRFADRIVCVSQATALQFQRPEQSKQVVVVHNGLPRDEYQAVDHTRVAGFKRRYGLPPGPLVGVIGRIKCGRKGQDLFVRAAALLRKQFPDTAYVLVGSPFPGNESHVDRVLALADELGMRDRVVWTGDVDDVSAAYATLDIVVVPSALPEPFAGVVIEAMAHGRPVVGTRIGGTVEQIEDGVTGLLVSPGDATDLAKAIGQLLGSPDLRRSFGEAGRRRFLDRFEFERFYARLEPILLELAGTAHPQAAPHHAAASSP